MKNLLLAAFAWLFLCCAVNAQGVPGVGIGVPNTPPSPISCATTPCSLPNYLSLAPGSQVVSSTVNSMFATFQSSISGTATGGTAFYNSMVTNNDSLAANAAGGQAIELLVGLSFGGANVTGGRHALVASLNQTATTGNAAIGTTYYTALTGGIDCKANDGGTAGSLFGNCFAQNNTATIESGATYFNSLVNTEFDVAVKEATNPPGFKYGIQIVQQAVDVAHASNNEAAINLANQPSGTAPGWNTVIQFGGPLGWWPVAATGTMIGTGSVTAGGPSIAAANGIDFSAVTFSGNFLKSTGFTVDGSGNESAASVALTGTTIPATGIYKPASAQLGFSANSAAIGCFTSAAFVVAATCSAFNAHDRLATSLSSNSDVSVTFGNTNTGANARDILFFANSTANAEAALILNGGANTGGNGANSFTINSVGNMFLQGGSTNGIEITSAGVVNFPSVATGTPAASLCIDGSGNLIKKTTTGSCI